jgi:hypothetical protein
MSIITCNEVLSAYATYIYICVLILRYMQSCRSSRATRSLLHMLLIYIYMSSYCDICSHVDHHVQRGPFCICRIYVYVSSYCDICSHVDDHVQRGPFYICRRRHMLLTRICVLILLYMRTHICVSPHKMCPHTALCMRPHTTQCVLILICVRILLNICPHTAICVRMLLNMCPHNAVCVLTSYYSMCPHTTIYMCPPSTLRVSSYYQLVLIVPHSCLVIQPYASSYYYICVRILYSYH